MRYIFLTVISAITLLILYFNIGLHTQNFSREETVEDIILQLNFIENELKGNQLGAEMQAIFPEGYIFVNALYGLTYCELAQSNSSITSSNLKEKAIKEALFAYNEMGGFSRTTKKEKKYLFGKLAMADVFIALGRASELNSPNYFRPH